MNSRFPIRQTRGQHSVENNNNDKQINIVEFTTHQGHLFGLYASHGFVALLDDHSIVLGNLAFELKPLL